MLKFPILKGIQNFPSLPSEGKQKLYLYHKVKKEQKLPFKTKRKGENPKLLSYTKGFSLFSLPPTQQKIYKDQRWYKINGNWNKNPHKQKIFFCFLFVVYRCIVCGGSRLFVPSLGRTFFLSGFSWHVKVYFHREAMKTFPICPLGVIRKLWKLLLFAPSGLSGKCENHSWAKSVFF